MIKQKTLKRLYNLNRKIEVLSTEVSQINSEIAEKFKKMSGVEPGTMRLTVIHSVTTSFKWARFVTWVYKVFCGKVDSRMKYALMISNKVRSLTVRTPYTLVTVENKGASW